MSFLKKTSASPTICIHMIEIAPGTSMQGQEVKSSFGCYQKNYEQADLTDLELEEGPQFSF